MNETQLIEGCKQHNPKAQKALYDTYARKMMSVCLRYGSNRETAEDLLQEVLSRFFLQSDLLKEADLLKVG